jgi:hypothetical protein
MCSSNRKGEYHTSGEDQIKKAIMMRFRLAKDNMLLIKEKKKCSLESSINSFKKISRDQQRSNSRRRIISPKTRQKLSKSHDFTAKNEFYLGINQNSRYEYD